MEGKKTTDMRWEGWGREADKHLSVVSVDSEAGLKGRLFSFSHTVSSGESAKGQLKIRYARTTQQHRGEHFLYLTHILHSLELPSNAPDEPTGRQAATHTLAWRIKPNHISRLNLASPGLVKPSVTLICITLKWHP